VPVYKRNKSEQDVAAAQVKEAKRSALKEKLALNGYALRTVLMNEQVKAHYVSPMAMGDEMSVEDILSEIPEEDLHEVGIVQGRIFMPASFAQKWIIPTLRVRKALSINEDESLPAGIETAMLYSIFDHSIINFAKQRSEFNADDSALRAIVAYANDDTTTVKSIPRMRQGNTGLTKGSRCHFPLSSLPNQLQ
jgi:hypothetical protein